MLKPLQERRSAARTELLELWKTAWPVSLATICRMALIITDMIFIGQLGKNELAASALAQVFLFICNIFLYGFAVSLNTLCSQAYGAKNYKLVGLWFQISVIVLSLGCIPVIFSCFFVEQMLEPFEDDPEVRRLAGEFAAYSAIGVWPMIIYVALRQYFQAISIVQPASVVSFVMIFFNMGLNAFFIKGVGSWEGLGFRGSPIATSSSYFLQLFFFYIYAIWWKQYHSDTWPAIKFSNMTLSRLRTFLGMAIPTGFTMFMEESVYQIMTLMAGHLGKTPVDALSALFNTWGLCWALWWGFGLGVQVRVGTHLGAGNARLAKLSAWLGLVITSLIISFEATIFTSLRRFLARPFSSDSEVLSEAEHVAHWLLILICCWTLGTYTSCVLDGLGRPTINMLLTGITQWILILPLAWYFSFRANIGLPGILLGAIAGEGAKFVVGTFFIANTNWKQMAIDAQNRSEKEPSLTANIQDIDDLREDAPLLLNDDDGDTVDAVYEGDIL
eukprot:m.309714 g.309714  ORF g.309714 m.309714 type:complete len:502 (+) comp23607_c0_seq1:54-1559(+)